MPETTETISLRVSKKTKQQVDEVAKAEGLKISEWVREQMMKGLHTMNPMGEADSEQPADPSESSTDLRHALEARIQGTEDALRRQIDGVKAAVLEAAKNHQGDLCTMAQVGLTVEESMEQRIEAACVEILDAIERLKQSQQSHKDTLVRVITQDQQPRQPRY
jgi:hypothetical protein